MLLDRIIGAFTFKREVYADVKKDTSFTPTAWGIVVVVNVINQLAGYLAAGAIAVATLGALGEFGDLGAVGAATSASLVGSIVSMVIGVVAFAVGAYAIMFVANSVFKATVKFDEVVRTVGLAYVWQIVGVLVVLAIISPAFLCLTGILGLAAAVLSAVASAIAIKEAIGLDWTQTIVTIVIAWIAIFIVTAILGSVVAGFAFMGAL
ncbi:MAG: YIP1 family protein [Chloroflexi bacterium]|nr:YIP1 family protein [Chloroflexota bacterium]